MNKNDEINKTEIAPTLTLARLYESQNQLFDALAIYDFLMGTNPREDIEQQRNQLLEKIFSDDKIKYAPIINKIMKSEDLKFFNIIPADKYQSYLQTYENKFEQNFPDELEIEDDEVTNENQIPNSEVDFDEEIESLKKEIVANEQPLQNETEVNANEVLTQADDKAMTIANFADKLIEKFGSDAKLDSISLDDFFSFIKEMG